MHTQCGRASTTLAAARTAPLFAARIAWRRPCDMKLLCNTAVLISCWWRKTRPPMPRDPRHACESCCACCTSHPCQSPDHFCGHLTIQGSDSDRTQVLMSPATPPLNDLRMVQHAAGQQASAPSTSEKTLLSLPLGSALECRPAGDGDVTVLAAGQHDGVALPGADIVTLEAEWWSDLQIDSRGSSPGGPAVPSSCSTSQNDSAVPRPGLGSVLVAGFDDDRCQAPAALPIIHHSGVYLDLPCCEVPQPGGLNIQPHLQTLLLMCPAALVTSALSVTVVAIQDGQIVTCATFLPLPLFDHRSCCLPLHLATDQLSRGVLYVQLTADFPAAVPPASRLLTHSQTPSAHPAALPAAAALRSAHQPHPTCSPQHAGRHLGARAQSPLTPAAGSVNPAVQVDLRLLATLCVPCLPPAAADEVRVLWDCMQAEAVDHGMNAPRRGMRDAAHRRGAGQDQGQPVDVEQELIEADEEQCAYSSTAAQVQCTGQLQGLNRVS